jgi:hypothetical protein
MAARVMTARMMMATVSLVVKLAPLVVTVAAPLPDAAPSGALEER